MGAFWVRREERLGEQSLLVFFGQYGKNAFEEPLKGCNEVTKLLRTLSFLICTCGMVGIYYLTVKMVHYTR